MVQRNSYVECGVYDVTGKLVKILFAGMNTMEDFRLGWDLKDENGKKLNAGMYLLKIRTDTRQNHVKIVIVK